MPTAYAPGRVTLMGDHTDYSGGLSLAMAINLGTTVEFSPDPSSVLLVDLGPICPPFSISLPCERVRSSPGPQAMIEGVLSSFRCSDSGGSLKISTTLPLNAGLSSSASLIIALALALGAEQGDLRSFAKLCQRAESKSGSSVGLLDQLAILSGIEASAVRIDFSDLSLEQIPLRSAPIFTVIHTGISRSLTQAPYAERRQECAEATELLGPLSQSSMSELRGMKNPVLRRRARHVFTESSRVDAMIAALSSNDLVSLGSLMNESHRSLSEDFESSLPSIDDLADSIRQLDGVLGVRLSGAGFGGCLMILSDRAIKANQLGPCWTVKPSNGPSIIYEDLT